MERWINELWDQLRTAEWGTKDLLDAVWELCGFVDAKLIPGEELDRRLNERVQSDLMALRKQVPMARGTHGYKTRTDWRRQPATWVEEEAA